MLFSACPHPASTSFQPRFRAEATCLNDAYTPVALPVTACPQVARNVLLNFFRSRFFLLSCVRACVFVGVDSIVLVSRGTATGSKRFALLIEWSCSTQPAAGTPRLSRRRLSRAQDAKVSMARTLARLFFSGDPLLLAPRACRPIGDPLLARTRASVGVATRRRVHQCPFVPRVLLCAAAPAAPSRISFSPFSAAAHVRPSSLPRGPPPLWLQRARPFATGCVVRGAKLCLRSELHLGTAVRRVASVAYH